MECDSVHAAIEARARNIDVYTPAEWETILKTARSSQPYKVITLSHTFWKKFGVTITSIRPGKGTGDPVVTDLRHILYTPLGDIFYSLSHFTPLRPLKVRKQRRGNIEPMQKYQCPLSVSQELPDLLQLCNMIVPPDRHSFYNSLV